MDNRPTIQNRFLREYSEVGAVAQFYGFQPITAPEIHKIDIDGVKQFDQSLEPEEKAVILRMYFEEKAISMPQPAMFWMERPFKGGGHKRRTSRIECSLVCLGSNKAVTDCLTIRAGLSILQTLGYKSVKVLLNSVGDKESVNEFERKLHLFVRKNFNSFPPDLRQAAKKDIFVLAREVRDEWTTFQNECPKPIDFLSEASRIHFKEVLEFLEIMNINYSIDQYLIGDPHLCSETIFAFISEKDPKENLGLGMRSNRLAKKLGHKKEVPFVMLSMSVKSTKVLKRVKAKNTPPDFYLIQFGPEAKLKSLFVLEELRKAGKRVAHSIARDKLSSQIGIAEDSGIPYILLLGQKEALENSVLLRYSSTRAQELIPIPELTDRIKKL